MAAVCAEQACQQLSAADPAWQQCIANCAQGADAEASALAESLARIQLNDAAYCAAHGIWNSVTLTGSN